MRKNNIDMMLDEFVLEIFNAAKVKDKELMKSLIIYKSFYKEIKPSLDEAKVSFKTRREIISKFLVFVVQFETICVRACKPRTGSQSIADDIISMYSSKSLNFSSE